MSTTVHPGVAAPTVLEAAADFSARMNRERSRGASIGLVPTMGALHEGHRSLVERACSEDDVVALTLFVNPRQFDNPDDLIAYPRDPDGDIALAASAGARYVFAPSAVEMYPPDAVTTVSVPGISAILEGASRPGHFDGVATVVCKLFSLAGPCRAYFGEKDYQQLQLVRRMVADLNLPVDVVGCPTVRESDGLAMSSRNRRLSGAERVSAGALYRALCAGSDAIGAGETNSRAVGSAMKDVIDAEPGCTLDYAVALDSDLSESSVLSESVRLLVAAQVGPVRLIDNIGTFVPSSQQT